MYVAKANKDLYKAIEKEILEKAKQTAIAHRKNARKYVFKMSTKNFDAETNNRVICMQLEIRNPN